VNVAVQSSVAKEPSASEQRRAVEALLRSLRAQHPAGTVTLIETHISFVLLAGPLAYKIKKAVDLGFLDFTTLAQRHFYCDEELRLNRRLAPALYLEVLPITGTAEQPALNGDGPVIEWALRMQAFAQDDLWDRLASRGALRAGHIDELAEALAEFHGRAAVADAADPRGQAAQLRAPVQDTLRTLAGLTTTAADRDRLDALAGWEAMAFGGLRPVFDERQRDGHVRECHGDLHLGNVTLVGGRTTLFDCLEFNPALRWTDVMSDVAFMAMDLHAHRLPRLAHRFVNGYVERSGDHGGLRLLRYHSVYRALVRAKIAALRKAQLGDAGRAAAGVDAHDVPDRYIEVAMACSRQEPPTLILTHGCSGSGKSLATQTLLERCGAIRIRADVERKRLFGLPPLARSSPAKKAELYSAAATEATQARLRTLAELVLASGHSVILDATFLLHAHREQARALAEQLGVGFVIIDFQASVDTLRCRVQQRMRRQDDSSDADLAVLEQQLASAEPLREDERAAVFVFDSEPAYDEADADASWAGLLHRIGVAQP
jgi:aminoglycoside phosphotransferase family enzyme/predicted kinase